jgi:aerobic-type carbon monoxide dehydrogenase small subunit (CoxS/CutS family)
VPRYSLTINGRAETVEVPAGTPLLWVLREDLGLSGTKYGCGVGLCRACVVHLDGVVTPSCQLHIELVAGKTVTTIEGLSPDRSHALQRAWLVEDVPQCGYCQSGQLMAAAALLARNPKPSEDEIDTWMSMQLCRCGTYNRVRRAILRAAGELLAERENSG